MGGYAPSCAPGGRRIVFDGLPREDMYKYCTCAMQHSQLDFERLGQDLRVTDPQYFGHDANLHRLHNDGSGHVHHVRTFPAARRRLLN